MKHLIILACTCVLNSSLLAQITYAKGYVLPLKGDTVRGEIKMNPKKPTEIYEKVGFKDANGVQKNYKPEKLRAYGIENEHFISLTNAGDPVFYKILAKGEINFYLIMYEAIEMNEILLVPEYYISHPDNKKLVAIKKNKFKKQLTDWMKDNTEFIDEFEEEKTLDVEKAIAVINAYNAYKAKQ
jgi:hypothetical protein